MKIIYNEVIYENTMDVPYNILKTIKNANKYNKNKEIGLYVVGGAVRDQYLGAMSKDIDFLVTNVTFNDMKIALSKIADNIVSTNVGENLNVLKVKISNAPEPYDFSIPRSETYGMSGSHTDIVVNGNPIMDLKDELLRRDFTMNAIAYDVETGTYIDPFNGINDIHNKVIRAVGNPIERFNEDPLRILRAIQFANRFGFTIEDKTLTAIKNSIHLLDKVTGERILEEFKKAFTKGKYASNKVFIELMVDTGIGKHLFGPSFNPIISDVIYGDRMMTNMILTFINGGNFSKLKPSNEIVNSINLAREIVNSDPLKVMYKNKKYLSILKDAFKTMKDSMLITKINSLDGVPLENKDLAIESEYLMSLGYEGAGLGKIQKELINAIYERRINNNVEDIKSYLDNTY